MLFNKNMIECTFCLRVIYIRSSCNLSYDRFPIPVNYLTVIAIRETFAPRAVRIIPVIKSAFFRSSLQTIIAYNVFGNGFLDTLAARFRQSGKRTADVSDFCLPEHQGLVHPLARAVELDESSMVDHPVDHRGGKLVVAQDRSPFAELDVGGEHHTSLLVAC